MHFPAFPGYRPGACLVGVAQARILRGRGDRRGFEPLDPGPLPGPDTEPPPFSWNDGECPFWDGRPVNELVVNLGAGLGDVIRCIPVVRAIHASGRVGRLFLLPLFSREPGARTWLRNMLKPLEIWEGPHPVAPDAGLHSFLWIPRFQWNQTPVAPLTSLVARVLDLPLAMMAGPCAFVDPDALARVDEWLHRSGWRGEALVAVQGDRPPEVTDMHARFRNAKLAAPLVGVMPAIRERCGAFVVAMGGPGETLPAMQGLADQRGASLDALTALTFRADLVVAGDSAPMHLAGILGTPAIGLFGPSDPRIQVCAAGTLAALPEARTCSHLPCGAGTLTGRPERRGTYLTLPCPAEVPCLGQIPAETLVRMVERVLGKMALGLQ